MISILVCLKHLILPSFSKGVFLIHRILSYHLFFQHLKSIFLLSLIFSAKFVVNLIVIPRKVFFLLLLRFSAYFWFSEF